MELLFDYDQEEAGVLFDGGVHQKKEEEGLRAPAAQGVSFRICRTCRRIQRFSDPGYRALHNSEDQDEDEGVDEGNHNNKGDNSIHSKNRRICDGRGARDNEDHNHYNVEILLLEDKDGDDSNNRVFL